MGLQIHSEFLTNNQDLFFLVKLNQALKLQNDQNTLVNPSFLLSWLEYSVAYSNWGVVFRLICLASHKEYVPPAKTKGVWQSNILNIYKIPLVYCVFIALLSPIYVLNNSRASWMYIQSSRSSNHQKTLDKYTNPNRLQTSCFYYISWNTYSLQFSLKRCLAPCTVLNVKLKHAQILQYKGVRLKHSVLLQTLRGWIQWACSTVSSPQVHAVPTPAW